MSVTPRQAFVGVGSNLGDREKTLAAALDRLRSTDGISWTRSSSLFETEPVGKTDQPVFLNAVIGVSTVLSPEALLETLQSIECEFGRVRAERWGPRTLDLDLLLFEGEERSSATLTLPHPRFLERGFVTVPLAELLDEPAFQLPVWASLRAHVAPIRTSEGVRRVRAIS